MKTNKKIHCFLLLLWMAAGTGTVSTAGNTDTTSIDKKIENKNYTLDIQYCTPMRGSMRYLNYGYTLILKNDSVLSYLPYFGVIHSNAPMGGEGGIIISDKYSDYSSTLNKKKDGWNIRFKAQKDAVTYTFHLDIYKNGNTYINVLPSNGDAISYSGHVNTTLSR